MKTVTTMSIASGGCVGVDHIPGGVVIDTTRALEMTTGEARALAHVITEHATAAGAAEAQQPAPVLTVDLLGRAAYLAYCAATDGRSAVTGDVLPPWDQLMPEVREAWRAAADGVQMVISVGRPAT
jgi:hypothetical protein